MTNQIYLLIFNSRATAIKKKKSHSLSAIFLRERKERNNERSFDNFSLAWFPRVSSTAFSRREESKRGEEETKTVHIHIYTRHTHIYTRERGRNKHVTLRYTPNRLDLSSSPWLCPRIAFTLASRLSSAQFLLLIDGYPKKKKKKKKYFLHTRIDTRVDSTTFPILSSRVFCSLHAQSCTSRDSNCLEKREKRRTRKEFRNKKGEEEVKREITRRFPDTGDRPTVKCLIVQASGWTKKKKKEYIRRCFPRVTHRLAGETKALSNYSAFTIKGKEKEGKIDAPSTL